MKKTLLLALIGASTFAVASGEVKTGHEVTRKTEITRDDQGVEKEESKITSKHNLFAKISENNITAEVKLEGTGKEEAKAGAVNEKEYKFSKDGEKSYVQIAYDDKTIAASLKYALKNELTAMGSYTYKNDVLTVKPAVKYVGNLNPKSLQVSNHIGYVINPELSLGNDIIVDTNLNPKEFALLTVKGNVEYKHDDTAKVTNVLTVKKSLNDHHTYKKELKFKINEVEQIIPISTELKGSFFSIGNETTGEVTLAKQLKLEPKLNVSFNTFSHNKVEKDKPLKDNTTTTTMKLIDTNVNGSIKATYTPEVVKGLEVVGDLKFKYSSMNNDYGVKIKIAEKEKNIKVKSTFVDKDLNGSLSATYKPEVVKGLKVEGKVSYDARTVEQKIIDGITNKNSKGEEPKETLFYNKKLGLSGSVSYDIALNDQISLTPSTGLSYDHLSGETKIVKPAPAGQAAEVPVINKISGNIGATLGYKMDKFDTSLGIKLVRNWKTDDIKPVPAKEPKKAIQHSSTDAVVTFNLGYTW